MAPGAVAERTICVQKNKSLLGMLGHPKQFPCLPDAGGIIMHHWACSGTSVLASGAADGGPRGRGARLLDHEELEQRQQTTSSTSPKKGVPRLGIFELPGALLGGAGLVVSSNCSCLSWRAPPPGGPRQWRLIPPQLSLNVPCDA